MKRLSFIVLAITLIVSCQTKQEGKQVAIIDTTNLITKADTSDIKGDSHFFWTSELDPEKGLVMKKTTPISNDL